MFRGLIVIGLIIGAVGTTATGAEARLFRLSFRPRLFPAARTYTPRFERKLPSGIVILRKEETDRPPVQSILDGPGRVTRQTIVAPISPDEKAALAKKAAEQAAHWCDNGKIVGSGTGFCVLKVAADDPS